MMACLADGRMDIIVCTKKVRNGSCALDLPTVENKEERKKEREGKKRGCRLVSSFDLVSSRLLVGRDNVSERISASESKGNG